MSCFPEFDSDATGWTVQTPKGKYITPPTVRQSEKSFPNLATGN
jgi:hypothetical protein